MRFLTGSPAVRSGDQHPAALTVSPALIRVPSPRTTPPSGSRARTSTPVRSFDLVPRGAPEEKQGRGRRIQHGVVRDEQPAPQSGTQVRLGFPEARLVENFRPKAPDAAKFRFPPGFGHFLLVGRHPQRSAGIIIDIRRELRGEIAPETARIRRQRELGLGVVHHDDMAHRRGRRPPADGAPVEDDHRQARARAFRGAGGPDDARSDDGRVPAGHQPRIPQMNGSSSSRISVDSAVTNAVPVMDGMTAPSRIA